MSDVANDVYVELLKGKMPETIEFGEESLELFSVEQYGPNEIKVLYAGLDIDLTNREIPDEIMSEIKIEDRVYHRSGSGFIDGKRMYLYSPQNIDHDGTENPDE